MYWPSAGCTSGILNLLECLQAGGIRRGQQRDTRLRNGSGRRVQILNPGVEQVAPLLERGRVGADVVADAHQGVEPAVLFGLELAALGRHDVALAQPGCAGQSGSDHHALQRLTGCVADPGHQGRGRDRVPPQKQARRTHRVRVTRIGEQGGQLLRGRHPTAGASAATSRSRPPRRSRARSRRASRRRPARVATPAPLAFSDASSPA